MTILPAKNKETDVLDSLSGLTGSIFIYAFGTYIMNTYYLPGMVRGTRDIAVNKTHKNSHPDGAYILMKIDNKQVYKICRQNKFYGKYRAGREMGCARHGGGAGCSFQ